MKNTLILFVISVFLFAGCYYDNEADLYQFYQNQCDTTSISYSADIEPIMVTQCVSCHSGTNPDGNVGLENHSEVQFSAENGSLYGCVTNTNDFNIMPPAGALFQCDIDKIDAWIKAGMPNN